MTPMTLTPSTLGLMVSIKIKKPGILALPNSSSRNLRRRLSRLREDIPVKKTRNEFKLEWMASARSSMLVGYFSQSHPLIFLNLASVVELFFSTHNRSQTIEVESYILFTRED